MRNLVERSLWREVLRELSPSNVSKSIISLSTAAVDAPRTEHFFAAAYTPHNPGLTSVSEIVAEALP